MSSLECATFLVAFFCGELKPVYSVRDKKMNNKEMKGETEVVVA